MSLYDNVICEAAFLNGHGVYIFVEAYAIRHNSYLRVQLLIARLITVTKYRPWSYVSNHCSRNRILEFEYAYLG